MFRIEMLPARQGDCLWIEYGRSERQVHRVLIDGGVVGTYDALRDKIARLPRDERRFELVVLTHVDRDHIEGMIKLFGDPHLGLTVDEIWYNGWRQLEAVQEDAPADLLGSLQGEFLSALIAERDFPWNTSFGGGPVMAAAGPETRTLEGGLELTVLAPDRRNLARLLDVWRDAVLDEGIDPGDADAALAHLRHKRPELVPRDLLGDEEPLDVDALAESRSRDDRSRANASSLALLASYEGKTCLFAADSPPKVLLPALSAAGVRRLDAWKLSHHGSKKSTSLRQLATVESDRYLFSTDGSYYDHPDDETIARILTSGQRSRKTLIFNYPLTGSQAERWNDPALQDRYDYEIVVDPRVEL